jgi:hypothetical protein
VTPDERERLALELERAARLVRTFEPHAWAAEVRDDVPLIEVGVRGYAEYIEGRRSPELRSFRIEW